MDGLIFDIKHFAVHDGDGIRTTVFLNGCPLRCVWCHNPEGISRSAKVGFFAPQCVMCGECARVCHRHTVKDGGHTFDRETCTACGECVAVCPVHALRQYGRRISVDDLMTELLRDRDFYEKSGGGITLSGGECLVQAEFCAEVLRMCKANHLNTAVDTCGFVSRDSLNRVIPYTDMFLYDIKALDEQVHIRCTGQSNRRILDNLLYLDSLNIPVEIRVPFVPGYNDGEIAGIAGFIARLTCVRAVRVLPYHNFARSKYDALGMTDTLPPSVPTPEELQAAVRCFTDAGITCR